MKIGLIIPYKNSKKWLTRCLDSIKGDFKVVLVSDHAERDEVKIAREWAVKNERKMHVFLDSDIQRGVSHARNRGIMALLGTEYNRLHDPFYDCDYITFLDSDDELTPDAYDVISEAIRFYPDDEIIQLNHIRERPDGSRYNKFYNARGDRGLDNLPSFWVGVWNKIYKSSLLRDIRFDVNLKHGEDELFNLEALAIARKISCYEKIAVIHHFDNPESLSKLTDSNDLFEEQHALLSFLSRNEEDDELCEAVRRRQLELWNNPVYKKIFGGA